MSRRITPLTLNFSVYMEVNGQIWPPSPFTAQKRALGFRLIRGWLGPMVGMDILEKTQNSCPCQEPNQG